MYCQDLRCFAISPCSLHQQRFWKMNGCGNDFIVLNCLDEPSLQNISTARWSTLAMRLCQRPKATPQNSEQVHMHIGADGLLLLLPGTNESKFTMRVFNLDGSEAAMCGNAIRCLARFLLDEKLLDGDLDAPVPIWTKSGIKNIRVLTNCGNFVAAAIDMGFALAVSHQHQLLLTDPPKELITMSGKQIHFTPVSMGNPHAVVFGQPVDAEVVAEVNRHPLFWPEGVNVGFCEILSETPTQTHLRLQVWERGAGLTQACGTGACAAAVAYFLEHQTNAPSVLVSLPGGDLVIDLKQENQALRVFMTGPAVYEFSGILSLVEAS